MKRLEQFQTIKAKLNASEAWTVLPDRHGESKAKIQSLIDDGYETDELSPVPNPMSEVGSGPFEIIEVSGELIKGGGLDEIICALCGVCDIDNISAQLKSAAADDSVSIIVLNFNSPGGSALGVKELSELISSVSQQKMVLGYTSTLCASGGYWLASQCSMFFCSDSCKVGNVGCWQERVDMTEALDKAGVKVNIIKDGEFKVMGHPATEMSDKEEQMIQESVTTIAEQFRQSILSNRQVDPQFLQGQVFFGEKAADRAINLADGNANDLDTLLIVFANLTYLYQ